MKIFTNPNSKTWASILARPTLDTQNLNTVVKDILQQVKKNGDAALKKFNLEFDKVTLDDLEVSDEEFADAQNQVTDDLKKAIQTAAQNITKFHVAQRTSTIEVETMPGVKCWQKSIPIEKVGLYIPGGTAPLFSTILMLGVPAKAAGCEEIILCTPPQKDGKINPVMLYTARLVGIQRVFKVGGAQAIGAMTYGTESIPSVYKIFGPGNQYVTTAKQLVTQENVAIDMPAGPSEVLVVADKSAIPSFAAADLLSQAEHGVDSQVVLITFSEEVAEAILEEAEQQLKQLPRRKIAGEALENSPVIIFDDKTTALDLINEYAPEHLIIATTDADDFSKKIKNAGSIFIGNYTPEAIGDYASGTNHTLPTNGFAKNYSGVNLDAFSKKITYQKLTKEGLQNLGKSVELMAEAEQLEGHKNAVSLRLIAIKNLERKEQLQSQKKDIKKWVRPNVLNLMPYTSAREEFKGNADVLLDANENPFNNNINRYPDPFQGVLKAKVSEWRKVPVENIFFGNGSDEIIGLLMQIFCRPSKDSIVILPPTFGMYKVSAALSDIKIKSIPLTKDFQPNVKEVLRKADSLDKILFLCSPNNPTANNLNHEGVRKLVQEFDGIVVVDEAYIDFTSQPSFVKSLEEFPNLIVLQTFSKAWGMAGARLGMAFASSEIVALLNKVKLPYNINQLTQRAVIEAFDKQDIFRSQVQIILEQRNWLEKELNTFSFVEKIFPSDANFLLVKTNAPHGIYSFLTKKNIIVRNRSKQIGCAGCLRITIGTALENQRLVDALKIYETTITQNEKSIISR